MARAASEAAVATQRGSAGGHARHAPDVATAAWAGALPCAAIAAIAILLLGPPLGHLLPDGNAYHFLGGLLGGSRPEPTEQGRFLVAVCVPLLAALALARAPGWLARVPDRSLGAAVVAAQLALAAVVLASIVAQYRMRFGIVYTRGFQPTFGMHYFSPATLIAAVLLTGAAVAASRSAWIARRAAVALLRESRARRLVVTGLAAAATALWMLHAVHTDTEIGNAVEDVRYHLGFTLDETFAVLNGHTPLVDFSAQYGSLWPFVLALAMLALGKTVLTFTAVACAVSALALLAVFGVLRRAAPSATAALLVYLPFLATSLFMVGGTPQNRSSAGSYFASFPLRYAIPYFVAWLTARQLERGFRAAGVWLLFTVAGLAVLNNGDFGVAALGASVATLLLRDGRPTRHDAARLAGLVVAGLATALALVSLLTLVRAGSLPRIERLVDYARLYAAGGFALMPIPGVLGIHLLIYLTYVGALVVATVRMLRRARGRVLTGMLLWAGVFGLGASAYWVGRSHPVALVYELSAWSLALALLTLVAVRELAAPRLRRTAIGALVVLFGFGVMTCSLAQTPTPWGQIERLRAPFEPTELEPDLNPLAPSPRASVRRFVSSLADGPSRFVVRSGAPVAILLTTGHRVADAYGLTNVLPYTGVESLITVERAEAALDALNEAGGNTVILPNPTNIGIVAVLDRRGFDIVTANGLRRFRAGHTRPLEYPWPGGGAVVKWVDTRHLHPKALAGR
jgi:hypothetical protein